MKTISTRDYAVAVTGAAMGNEVTNQEELLLLSGKSLLDFHVDVIATTDRMRLHRIETLLMFLVERQSQPESPRLPDVGQVATDWL